MESNPKSSSSTINQSCTATTQEIITHLNHLLADEWLSHFQYWAGAHVCKGAMRKILVEEMLEHSHEELEHANAIAKRIVQLGGQVIIHPSELHQHTTCGYKEPKDPSAESIIKQNMESELCTIHSLKKVIEMTEHCDCVTHDLLRSILKTETEHASEMRRYLEDIEHCRAHAKM